MTIEDDDSPESGWVFDGDEAANVWRYGTERPCNLAGRYVTIVANYRDVTKPYEIALCQWAVLGNRIILPDEDVVDLEPEPVPPTFAEDLQPSVVNRDEASSWVLPEVIIGTAALVEVVVIPDLFLTKVIDYDAQS